MIAHLSGTISELEGSRLVLDVGGVGYEMLVTHSVLAEGLQVGTQARLFTHLIVREDAQQLFGFESLAERQLFRVLIRVSGVGPKLALALLSGFSVASLVATITHGDAKKIAGIPGIGRRTAERLIVELRDKLGMVPVAEVPSGRTTAAVNLVAEDAETALIGLGYRPAEAARAIARVLVPDVSLEELVRKALRELSEPASRSPAA